MLAISGMKIVVIKRIGVNMLGDKFVGYTIAFGYGFLLAMICFGG
jgi:hypothetical protein